MDQEEAGSDQEPANDVDENQEQDVPHEEENCGEDVEEEEDADADIERSLRRSIELISMPNKDLSPSGGGEESSDFVPQ